MRSRISPSLKYRSCVILSVLDLIHKQKSNREPIELPSWQFSLRTLLVIRFQFVAIRSQHDTHGLPTLNAIHCDKIGRKLEY